MEILEGLTEEQKEAVTHGQGPLLVLAGVGTGKTTVITRRIAYLIDQRFVERPSQLLVFTFSNQAAEEMLDRAFEWIRYAALDAWVATYHSVCERILRENAPLAGLPPDFRVLDEWDQRVFLLDHLTDLPLRTLRSQALRHPLSFLSPVLSFIHRAKDEAVAPEAYLKWLREKGDTLPKDERELHLELAEIYKTYQDLLSQEGLVDFGDLVLRAVTLLEDRPSLLQQYHERFPFVLADEFQDTSRAELRLVTLLGGHGNVAVVGDDDQAIYGFRGVPWDNLLSFLRAFPGTKMVVLTQNFRSTQKILDSAVRLIRHNSFRLEALSIRGEIPERVTKELVSPHGPGLPPIHKHFPTVAEEAEFVAQRMRELHEEGLAYGEMAVLYRNRYRPEPYLRALSEAEIPWALAGGFRAGLFDQEEIKVVMSFLRALADPRDDQSLYHLLGSPIYGMDGADLANLTALSHRTKRPLRQLLEEAVAASTLSKGGMEAVQRALADLDYCERLSRGNPTGQVLYTFLVERTGYLVQLARKGDAQSARALENIAAFFEEVVRRFEEVARYDRVPWFVHHVDELRDLGWNPMVGEAEPGMDAVQVMTFHQAKGREFAAVFLTGLVEDFMPGRVYKPPFTLPQELTLEDLPPEVAHLEEQRRLFYVGMTRAKRHLFLLSSDDYRLPGEEPRRRPAKISRFVLEALGEDALAERAPETPPLFRIHRVAVQTQPLPVQPWGDTPLQLSYRQVDDWLTCPLKYRYIHVLRIPIRLHPTVILGNAVHQAIQAYHLAKAHGRSLPVEELLAVFDRAWRSEGFLSQAHEEALRDHGKEALRRFYAFEEEGGGKPALVEQFFAFTEEGVKVIGYWDRVDRRKDGAVIIDYKTVEAKVDSADRRAKESLQLAIYALAYQRAFGELPKEVQLRFLTPEVVVGRAEPNERMVARAREEVLRAAEGIRAGDFQAKPSFSACGPCAYRSICPAALPL